MSVSYNVCFVSVCNVQQEIISDTANSEVSVGVVVPFFANFEVSVVFFKIYH